MDQKIDIIQKIPIVSVCVVTFNQERYILDCLMSVIAQHTNVSLEILVGDDHSTDSTSSIIKELADKFPHLIYHFYHINRLGFGSKNYHFLIGKAKGKYIAHLDGDDFWLPGKLAAQVNFMEKNPDCPAVYTNAFTIRDDGQPMGLFNNPQPTRININELVRHGNFLNNSSILYRASLRENILTLQPPFLDYQIHLRHAQHGAIGYINQALVAYRVNSSSSVIIQSNNLVRHLYWNALLDVPRELILKKDLAKGMADFMRRIFFRSIRIKSCSLIYEWWPRIMIQAPVGRIRMIYWTLLSIFRTGLFEIIGTACARISRSQIKVLYWH